ncbi:MAG: hypothetical protein JXL80_14065 [Planctomycetes bacterium]|nr:hypothetical protein [Planctomycetota bacterium]
MSTFNLRPPRRAPEGHIVGLGGEVVGEAPPMIGPATVRQAIKPLGWIFMGALVYGIDFRINNFDLMNDAIGMIFIACGIFRLSDIRVHDRYRRVMAAVKAVSFAALAAAVTQTFLWNQPQLIGGLLSLVGLAGSAAAILFCVAMRWLCQEANLLKPWRSWTVTLVLMTICTLAYFGTAGIATAARVTGGSFQPYVVPLAIVTAVLAVAALIHILISVSRMKKAAEQMKEPAVLGAQPTAEPVAAKRSPGRFVALAITIGLVLSVGIHVLGQIPSVRRHWIGELLVENRSITSCSMGSAADVSGNVVYLQVGKNAYGDVRVVVLLHGPTSTSGTASFYSAGGAFGGSVPGMKSTVEIRTHPGPGTEEGGLWIDGVKRPLIKPLTVIYVSDKYAATEIEIPEDEQEQFLQDVKMHFGSGLIDKWITPRLPPPTP